MKKTLLYLALAAAPLMASALTPVVPVVKHQQAMKSPVVMTGSDDRFSVMPGFINAVPAATPAPALRADVKSMTFALCSSPYTALSFKSQTVGDVVKQCVELDLANAKKFAGNQITAINIANPMNNSGTNPIRNVTVFLTHDLEAEPFYTQDGTLGSKGGEYSTVTLDTPCDIKGDKPIYFGYTITLTQACVSGGVYYVVVDGVPTDNYSAGWLYFKADGKYAWDSAVEYYGGLCITATITGDKLPENEVKMAGLDAPVSTAAGEEFSYVFGVQNEGVNEVSNLELEYTIDGESKTVSVNLPEALAYGETGIYGLSGPVATKTGMNLPMSLRVTKVNGNDNKLASVTSSDYYNCLPAGKGFMRNVVIEEGTGTWCQYCPLGYTLMEYAREAYTDGSLIPIAIHNQDEMAIADYQAVIQAYFSGFPQYIANRDLAFANGFGRSLEQNKAILQSFYTELRSYKSVADVELEAVYTDATKTMAKVTASTQFAMDTDNPFRYVIVLTEDNVGPYRQTNGLVGQDCPGYEQFTRGSQYVNLVFNDVARSISAAGGVQGSVPTGVSAGQTYTYDYNLSLSGVKTENCHVIAMLLNGETGEVENAKMVKLTEGGAGVESAVADGSALTVSGTTGAVVFNGEYTTANIYTTAGALVATAAGESSVALPAGLYLVKADQTVAKVVVK